jgi:hypothetical protein
MDFASAYPNSAISAGAMAAIAIVAAGCLAFWLVMVFLADRSSGRASRQARSQDTVVARPDEAAEDEHGEAGPAGVERRHGAAA